MASTSTPIMNLGFEPNRLGTVDYILATSAGLSLIATLYMLIDISIRIYRKIKRGKPVRQSTQGLVDESSILLASASRNFRPLSDRNSAKNIWILNCYGEILVLSLVISDLGSSFWYLGGLLMKVLGSRCYSGAAFVGTIFEPASVLWVCCISSAVYILLNKSQTFQTREKLIKSLRIQLICFMVISWVLPILLATSFIFIKGGIYGDHEDELWCWIKSQYSDFSLFMFNIPVIVAFVYNLVILLVIWSENKKKKLGYGKLYLLLYIPIFLTVWAFETAVAFYPHFADDNHQKPPFILECLAAGSLPSQGFFNAVIWAWLLRTRGQERVFLDDEEVFLFAQSKVNRTKMNLFGIEIEWFLERDLDDQSKSSDT